MSDAADPRPKWRRLYDDLVTGIHDGTHPVGSRLPSMSELMDRYDVSTTTVRKVWDRMEEAGYIERQHGLGMAVIRTDPTPQDVDDIAGLRRRVEALERAVFDPNK